MNRLLFAFPLLVVPMISGNAAQRVHGYTKKSGTHVAPYQRTKSDHSRLNNWSTKGNIDPFTGKAGTKKGKPNAHP